MDFHTLFHPEAADPEIGTAFKQLDTDDIISLDGKTCKIDLSIMIDAEIVSMSQRNFRSSFSCSQLISLNNGQVDNTLFIAKVSGSLDIDIPLDIAQTGITVTVIIRIARSKSERNTQCHKSECNHVLFHFSLHSLL